MRSRMRNRPRTSSSTTNFHGSPAAAQLLPARTASCLHRASGHTLATNGACNQVLSTMSIRDDEPPYAPRRTPSARRDPAERHRQLVARRGVAAVIGLVVVILIVLGVRGCLDARKTRSFENFNADLQSLVTQTH